MPVARSSRPTIVCALALFGLAGCSDPASETPVSLQPGLYELKVGSATPKADDKLCFASGDLENVDRMVRKYYYFLEDCSHSKEERIGNEVKGKVRCEIDPTTGWSTDYKASIAAQKLTIDATMVNYVKNDDPNQGNAEEITNEGRYTAVRIGVC